jgi:hypothetical protein
LRIAAERDVEDECLVGEERGRQQGGGQAEENPESSFHRILLS